MEERELSKYVVDEKGITNGHGLYVVGVTEKEKDEFIFILRL